MIDDAALLQTDTLTRQFGAVRALDGVSLTVRRGELLTLLGPSGSGKSTLLKLIAGFDFPDAGTVSLGGRDVTYANPASRNIGMVFQHYALFPHLSVFDNVAFPLRMRKLPRAEIDAKVRDVLERVELASFAKRMPRQLSGGQQQRVAVARAIVFGPGLLLLDEPFGALDRQLREHMQLEVRRLQREFGLTSIFVTHDQEEALLMSDRIAVMRDGRIVQIGTPPEIYAAPADAFVAGFVGESNLFRVRQRDHATLDCDGGVILPSPLADGRAGDEFTVLLRPESVKRIDSQSRADVQIDAEVQEVAYAGGTVKYRMQSRGLSVLARWHFDGALMDPGTKLTIGWNRPDMVAVGMRR